jgi:2-amino-4-hydroxy-6-hydroxymethyldihydropteridine diphosphokinase
LSTAYIGIGSNLGDRLEYVREAIRKLKQSKEIEICKASSVYETEPVGHKDQPCFLNMTIELKTTLEPLNLLEHILGIESQMGRTRPEGLSRRKRNRPQGTEFARCGPRNIDLDLLLYDDLVINSDKLTLPHPRLHQRRFVLVPLAEIAPKVVHPLLKESVERLLEDLSTDSVQTDGRLPVSEKDESGVRLYSKAVF